jgi:predicted  nucleic acid-binding Zn-ribbon protein
METIHTAEARALAELQRRDTHIDGLAAAAAAVPGRIAALEDAFEEKKASMSAAREALQALQAKKKDAELKIAEAEEGIRKHQLQLNQVKDNDAFKALLAEIEHDKADKDGLETAVLTLLEEIDRASSADKAVQAEVKSIEVIMKAQSAELAAEGAKLAAELEQARAARAAAAAALDPALLERYEAIRASRAGLAVAAVHEDHATGKLSCGGCHMGLTPQKALDVHKQDTLSVCSECRRLMYHEKTVFG